MHNTQSNEKNFNPIIRWLGAHRTAMSAFSLFFYPVRHSLHSLLCSPVSSLLVKLMFAHRLLPIKLISESPIFFLRSNISFAFLSTSPTALCNLQFLPCSARAIIIVVDWPDCPPAQITCRCDVHCSSNTRCFFFFIVDWIRKTIDGKRCIWFSWGSRR